MTRCLAVAASKSRPCYCRHCYVARREPGQPEFDPGTDPDVLIVVEIALPGLGERQQPGQCVCMGVAANRWLAKCVFGRGWRGCPLSLQVRIWAWVWVGLECVFDWMLALATFALDGRWRIL